MQQLLDHDGISAKPDGNISYSWAIKLIRFKGRGIKGQGHRRHYRDSAFLFDLDVLLVNGDSAI